MCDVSMEMVDGAEHPVFQATRLMELPRMGAEANKCAIDLPGEGTG